MLTEQWIKEVNNQLAKENIPHRQRAFKTIEKYSTETNQPVSFNSNTATFIFKWYKDNLKEGSQTIGSMYNSVLYFDGEFWELKIPIFFGKVKLNAIDSLTNMPKTTQVQLNYNSENIDIFSCHWSNCLDFALGLQHIQNNNNFNEFGLDFLNAAYEEITSASSLLSETKPNERAILRCRMATEMFFKAFGTLENDLSISDMKKIGHNLNKGLDLMIKISGFSGYEYLRKELNIFPKIEDRYKAQNINNQKLWKAFQLTQTIGALLTRHFSRINTLDQLNKL